MPLFDLTVEGPVAAKVGLLGFMGSGKTTTGALLAVALARTRVAAGEVPVVAMFDTEGGSRHLGPMMKALGVKFIGTRSRSFRDLEVFIQEGRAAGVHAYFVDSVTHVWRELCEAHLERVNVMRERRNMPRKTSLEFADWNPIKAEWARWAEWLANSPEHVVVAGRAGYEYEHTENDRGGKEINKVGVKMKAEGEFTFEPDVVCEMRRIQKEDKEGNFTLHRELAVLKARGLYPELDGKVFHLGNATAPAKQIAEVERIFAPVLAAAVAGTGPLQGAQVDTTPKSIRDEAAEMKEHRSRLLDEIKGAFRALYPSEKADDKASRISDMEKFFGERAWSGVETMDTHGLEQGLRTMCEVRALAIPRLLQPESDEVML